MLFAGKSETLATTARHSSSSAVGRRSTKTVDKKTVAKKPISTEPKQEDRQCRLYYVSSGKSDTGRSTDATSTKVTNTTKCYAKDSSTAAEATTTIVSKLTKVRCFHSASKNDRTSTVASASQIVHRTISDKLGKPKTNQQLLVGTQPFVKSSCIDTSNSLSSVRALCHN